MIIRNSSHCQIYCRGATSLCVLPFLLINSITFATAAASEASVACDEDVTALMQMTGAVTGAAAVTQQFRRHSNLADPPVPSQLDDADADFVRDDPNTDATVANATVAGENQKKDTESIVINNVSVNFTHRNQTVILKNAVVRIDDAFVKTDTTGGSPDAAVRLTTSIPISTTSLMLTPEAAAAIRARENTDAIDAEKIAERRRKEAAELWAKVEESQEEMSDVVSKMEAHVRTVNERSETVMYAKLEYERAEKLAQEAAFRAAKEQQEVDAVNEIIAASKGRHIDAEGINRNSGGSATVLANIFLILVSFGCVGLISVLVYRWRISTMASS